MTKIITFIGGFLCAGVLFATGSVAFATPIAPVAQVVRKAPSAEEVAKPGFFPIAPIEVKKSVATSTVSKKSDCKRLTELEARVEAIEKRLGK